MHHDQAPDQSTSDMAAVFMALIRAADEGVDVGDQIMTVGATLRTRTCRDLQDVAAFFAVARMIYAKAAAYGLRAADYPPYAQQIAPLMETAISISSRHWDLSNRWARPAHHHLIAKTGG